MQTLQKRKKKKTTNFLVRLYSTHTHTQVTSLTLCCLFVQGMGLSWGQKTEQLMLSKGLWTERP